MTERDYFIGDGGKPLDHEKPQKEAVTSLGAFLLSKGETNMGFQLEVKTGDAGPVIMRGCADGTVEFCKWGEATDPVTKVKTPALVAYKWFASIEQAFNRIFSMRVSSYEADNIKDLVKGIKAIRADIKAEMGTTVTPNTSADYFERMLS